MEDVTPLAQNVIRGQRSIVAFELDAHFNFVQVAARLQMSKDLGVECWPISDRTIKRADIDKVKVVLWECPGRGYVVDFKLAVCGCEGRLNWGEVHADDFGTGVFWAK